MKATIFAVGSMRLLCLAALAYPSTNRIIVLLPVNLPISYMTRKATRKNTSEAIEAKKERKY